MLSKYNSSDFKLRVLSLSLITSLIELILASALMSLNTGSRFSVPSRVSLDMELYILPISNVARLNGL